VYVAAGQALATYRMAFVCLFGASVLLGLGTGDFRWIRDTLWVILGVAIVFGLSAAVASPGFGRRVTFLSTGGVAGGGPRGPTPDRMAGFGVPSALDESLALERPALGRDGQPYTGPHLDDDGHLVLRCPCEAPDQESARELMLAAHDRGGSAASVVRDHRSALVRATDPCVPLPPDLREYRTVVAGQRCPEVPVVYCSGYYSEALVEYLHEAGYWSRSQEAAAKVAMDHRGTSLNLGDDAPQVLTNSFLVWQSMATYDLLVEVRGGTGNF